MVGAQDDGCGFPHPREGRVDHTLTGCCPPIQSVYGLDYPKLEGENSCGMRLGLAWLGLAWLGLAWLGLAWLGKLYSSEKIGFVNLFLVKRR